MRLNFGIDFDLRGFAARVNAVQGDVGRKAQAAVKEAGEHILGKATDIVPHDTGVLQASGKVEIYQQGSSFVAVISYNTPYAVEQHENMNYRHKPGRTAKYLEIPLLTETGAVRRIIVRRMRL